MNINMDFTDMKPHEINAAKRVLTAITGCCGCHFSEDVVQTLCNLLAVMRIRTRPPDKCELCAGTSGGVLGNENVIENVIVCDYCTAMLMHFDDLRGERNKS